MTYLCRRIKCFSYRSMIYASVLYAVTDGKLLHRACCSSTKWLKRNWEKGNRWRPMNNRQHSSECALSGEVFGESATIETHSLPPIGLLCGPPRPGAVIYSLILGWLFNWRVYCAVLHNVWCQRFLKPLTLYISMLRQGSGRWERKALSLVSVCVTTFCCL